jgi:hypothetical protein
VAPQTWPETAPGASRRRLDTDMVRIFIGGIPGADTEAEEN